MPLHNHGPGALQCPKLMDSRDPKAPVDSGALQSLSLAL